MRQHPLGDLSTEDFLQNYWQKKPLLIRDALPIEQSPISAEELAGLACEIDDTARIIQEHHAEGPWNVSYGPFDDEDFTSLPASHWTLLVTDCEKHVPELRSLIEPFRFIPDWRIDDLMISYAADGGSVGPHVDQYDVFLLQLEGQREWQVGGIADQQACIPDLALNILEEFTAQENWLLSPGDMLYLPPGFAHHGVAQGPCLTASIGFRAPSHRDILHAWMDDMIMQIPENLRLTDATPSSTTDATEISAVAAEHFQSIIDQHLHQSAKHFKAWLGGYLTETGSYEIGANRSILSEATFISALNTPQAILIHTPYSRFSWQQDGSQIILSVNGKSWRLPETLRSNIRQLCQPHALPGIHLAATESQQWLSVLFQIYGNGAIDIAKQAS